MLGFLPSNLQFPVISSSYDCLKMLKMIQGITIDASSRSRYCWHNSLSYTILMQLCTTTYMRHVTTCYCLRIHQMSSSIFINLLRTYQMHLYLGQNSFNFYFSYNVLCYIQRVSIRIEYDKDWKMFYLFRYPYFHANNASIHPMKIKSITSNSKDVAADIVVIILKCYCCRIYVRVSCAQVSSTTNVIIGQMILQISLMLLIINTTGRINVEVKREWDECPYKLFLF